MIENNFEITQMNSDKARGSGLVLACVSLKEMARTKSMATADGGSRSASATSRRRAYSKPESLQQIVLFGEID